MAELLDPGLLELSELDAELTGQNSIIIAHKETFQELEATRQLISENNLLCLFTSGSQHKKLIALNKKAMFCSAKSVNEWLGVRRSDIWGIALPLYHIGSLSIFYRSRLAGSSYRHFNQKWDPARFSVFLNQNNISLLSLVPTQLYDLVKGGIAPGKSLRLALTGGARLDRGLYLAARELGWPVIPTYGMTECSSQVACAKPESLTQFTDYPDLFVLPHLEVKTNQDQRLCIYGDSLLSFSLSGLNEGRLEIERYSETQGYSSQDLGFVDQNRKLTVSGRADRQIKVHGHLVQLDTYEQLAADFFVSQGLKVQCAAISVEDIREGEKIHLFCSTEQPSGHLKNSLEAYLQGSLNKQPLPYRISWLSALPLLNNGKVDYASLTRLTD